MNLIYISVKRIQTAQEVGNVALKIVMVFGSAVRGVCPVPVDQMDSLITVSTKLPGAPLMCNKIDVNEKF